MTVVQYLNALRARWFVVASLTLLFGAAGAAYSLLQTPMYTANVQLFISISDGSADVSDLNQGGTFSQQRVRSYANIVSSPTVTSAVISALQLPYTPDELGANIEASSPVGTVLLDVAVTDSSAVRARDIANAIATEFPRLIDEIETPAGTNRSPVKVSVVRPASLPASSVSPRTGMIVGIGILAGLAFGVVSAVLRHGIDRTIRGKSDISAVVNLPVLGEIAEDPAARRQPLVVDDSATPRAEAFRALRTNTRFLSVDQKLSSLVVTGSLPDEGKTTVAANLAVMLAQSGEAVALIDGDLRRPSLADLFTLSSGVGLTNVLLGDVPVAHALQQWRQDLPLYVLTSGPTPPNPSELLGSSRLSRLIEALEQSRMTIIFDSPPLLAVTDAAILAKATGGAIVVTRIGKTKADQLSEAVEALRAVNATVLGVVANRVKKRKKATYGRYYTTKSGRAGGRAKSYAR